jgi:NitT/TauT family transport system substrate-binding protein
MSPAVRRIAAAGAATLLVAGCTAPPGGTARSRDPAVDKVTYLSLPHSGGAEAFVYVAIERGYFRDAGLDVTVRSGLGTDPNLKDLSTGATQYAEVDLTAALLQYGQPDAVRDFAVVGAVEQRSSDGLLALTASGITGPRDLAGRTLGAPPGSVDQVLFPTYARLAGVDAGKVRWLAVTPDQQPQVLDSRQVDGITRRVTDRPAVQRAASGRDVVTLPYSDVLVDLFGNVVAVSRTTATDNPDQVRRFTGALLHGLADALDDPAVAGQVYARHLRGASAPLAAAQTRLMRPYVDRGPGLGRIDAERAARCIALLRSAGALKTALVPDDVIAFHLIPAAEPGEPVDSTALGPLKNHPAG